MKLFEHPDFEQAIIRAAEHFRPRGLREAIIEKDYFVTEALRIIEQAAGDKVIFKGGTSLSKGWNLIQRFSEDIDIFLDPTAFDPPLGKKAIDRELKKLRQAIEQHPALTFVEKESQTIGGFGRNDRFEYVQRFAGRRRDPQPRIRRGRHRQRQGADRARPAPVLRGAVPPGNRGQPGGRGRRAVRDAAAAFSADIRGEDVRHPRQGRGVQDRRARTIGGYARHYYDLFCLAERPEVLAMLRSDEYAAIKADYDRISREHFAKSYVPPPDMSFAKSDALFPPAELRAVIAAGFEAQCRVLCFGPFPSWDEVQARLEEIRALL